MNILLEPNVAYLMLVGGSVVAILAIFAPGTGVLELGALIILGLAGYAIANLPINDWALVVLLIGVFPFLLALRRVPRRLQWVFLAVSIIALVAGSVFLFRTPTGGPAVNPALAVVVSLLVGVFLWFVARKGIEAMRRPAVNPDRVLGKVGQTRTPVYQEGTVFVGGEAWSAHSRAFIPAGTSVRVVSREGLILLVEPVYPPGQPL